MSKDISRFFRVFTPFLILLIVSAIVNYWVQTEASSAAVQTTGANPPLVEPARTITSAGSQAEARQLPISTAIANATEAVSTPSAMGAIEPTLIPDDVASLAGPPTGSAFSLSRPVGFYWYSAKPLEKGQSYALYLVGDGVERLLGELAEPNVGNGFQLQFDPGQIDLPAGEYYWEVRLFEQFEGYQVGGSEKRPIFFEDSADS